MTENEFDTLMQIVYSRWGARSYPDAVKRRIWYFWHTLPQKSFEHAIYTLLDTSRAAPMPGEFKLLAYNERERLGLARDKESETKPSNEAKCFDCGDSGNLFISRKENYEAWARWKTGCIRCACEAGQRRPTVQGPIWNETIARSYDKEPVYRAGLGDWRPKPDQSAVDMLRLLLGKADQKNRKGQLTPVKNIITPTDNPDGPDAA